MIEETLSAAKFRFEAKIQRKSALCSNEMSLKRPRTFDRIFARTFDERSLEQITKFAEFRLHYFCTILYGSYDILLVHVYYIHVHVFMSSVTLMQKRHVPGRTQEKLYSLSVITAQYM